MTKDHLLAMVLAAALSISGATALAADPHASYVGGAACAECHADEAAAWKGSHHDLAMQPAGEQTVLGDFSGTEFTAGGVTTRFYRDGERYMVRTDGPDGALSDFTVRYTFGADPLQQYLLELPGGRLQALGVAWDTRPRAKGGQRWFHLYPQDPPRAGERLHWTSPDQNWNHMCADCHSTDLLKRYDAGKDRYDTSYAQVNVGCEACHGPGAAHVAWARQPQRDADPRLAIRLDERRGMTWNIAPDTGQPVRSTALTTRRESVTCARCHSRRGQLTETYGHGAPLGDHYRLALLEPGLYHPDGQVLDEVYVHGSFLQSRMHAAGVTCSDCHEPHSLALRAEGDAMCATCHDASRYAVTDHHHHAPEIEAARCVSCHMPATTYMVVDPRRDHSFRVPRPDLSQPLGTPNACNGCHEDRDAAWAAAKVAAWTGKPPTGYQQHGTALHLARQGLPAALVALPGEARATIDADRLGAALEEYRASLLRDADRPEAQTNLGLLLTQLGDLAGAQRAYERALAIEPAFAPAMVNLADLLRASGRDGAAGERLDTFLTRHPEAASVHHVKGLWLVRRKQMNEAIRELRRAVELAPGDARFGYVLAVALHGTGQVDAALAELDRVLAVSPYHRDSLVAAVVWRQQRGEEPGDHAAKLLELQKLSRGG